MNQSCCPLCGAALDKEFGCTRQCGWGLHNRVPAPVPAVPREETSGGCPSDAELLRAFEQAAQCLTIVPHTDSAKLGVLSRINHLRGTNDDLLTVAQSLPRGVPSRVEPTTCLFCGGEVRDNPISLGARAHLPCIELAASRQEPSEPVADAEIERFWAEAPTSVGYEATRFALQEFLRGRRTRSGRADTHLNKDNEK